MAKMRIGSGRVYRIADYATPNRFDILLVGLTADDVLKTLTEENLSEIKFMTETGAVTGAYHNKTLRRYADNGDTLSIYLDDVGFHGDDEITPPQQSNPKPTQEERISALEEKLLATNILLGLEV